MANKPLRDSTGGVVTLESFGRKFSDEANAAIALADVIIAVDIQSQREYTVFGTPPLESTVSLKRPAAMRTVRIPFDSQSTKLEAVIELVRFAKRRAEAAGTDG